MHKYIKCKHQYSGRGLLLTISASVGKYLYVGELKEKTHFMSRKPHSTDQGKMCNQLEHENQAETKRGPSTKANLLRTGHDPWD